MIKQAKVEVAVQLTSETFVPEILKGTRNERTLTTFLKDPACLVVGAYGDNNIYRIKHSLEGYYFVPEDDRIQYLLHYKTHRFVPIDAVCQLEVWRDPRMMAPHEGPTLAQEVFRNVLLAKYGAVISDKIQTVFGKRFWQQEIRHALSSGKCVYYLKLSGTETGQVQEIVRVRDWPHFKQEVLPFVWGTDLKHQLIRLLIANQPVQFPDKGSFKGLLTTIQ